ncbi:hypothetical protein KR009_008038 [Drosophila setifemur]|nr:hypothetical protein KR009_008038 [Drosophila setifemur]
MPPKRHLDAKTRRRRNPVLLNIFLRDDEADQSPPVENAPFSQTQSEKLSSIGSIPSNGLDDSCVTPVMTPSTPGGSQEKLLATPSSQSDPPPPPPINVWQSTGKKEDKTDKVKNNRLSVEEFPDLGKHSKRSKPALVTSPDPALSKKATKSQSAAHKYRRRTGIMDPPVLGNFLPESILPPSPPSSSSKKNKSSCKGNTNRQQPVVRRLPPVAETPVEINQQPRKSPTKRTNLMRGEASPMKSPVAATKQPPAKGPADSAVSKEASTSQNAAQRFRPPMNDNTSCNANTKKRQQPVVRWLTSVRVAETPVDKDQQPNKSPPKRAIQMRGEASPQKAPVAATKQPPAKGPADPSLSEKATTSQNAAQRFRRRTQIMDTPVPGNFLPESISAPSPPATPPKNNNTSCKGNTNKRQQPVVRWLTSVRVAETPVGIDQQPSQSPPWQTIPMRRGAAPIKFPDAATKQPPAKGLQSQKTADPCPKASLTPTAPVKILTGQQRQSNQSAVEKRSHDGGGDVEALSPTLLNTASAKNKKRNRRASNSWKTMSLEFMQKSSEEEREMHKQVQSQPQQQQPQQPKKLSFCAGHPEVYPDNQLQESAMCSELILDANEFQPRQEAVEGEGEQQQSIQEQQPNPSGTIVEQQQQPSDNIIQGSKISKRRRRQRLLRSVNANTLLVMPSQENPIVDQVQVPMPEQDQVTTPEQDQVTPPEQVQVPPPEQEQQVQPIRILARGEVEEWNIPTQDQAQYEDNLLADVVPPPEQDQEPTPEQDQVPMPEQVQVPPPEQVQVPLPEQVQVPTAEQAQVPTPEQNQVPPPEQVQVTPPEQVQVPPPEQEQQVQPIRILARGEVEEWNIPTQDQAQYEDNLLDYGQEEEYPLGQEDFGGGGEGEEYPQSPYGDYQAAEVQTPDYSNQIAMQNNVLLQTTSIQPGCYYSAPAPAPAPAPTPAPVVATPLTPVLMPTPIQVANPPQILYYQPVQMPIENQPSCASQSVFRLASLPCTGVGTHPTQATHTSTKWPHHSPSSSNCARSSSSWFPSTKFRRKRRRDHNHSLLLSSISGPEHSQIHTLSSAEEEQLPDQLAANQSYTNQSYANQSYTNQELLFTQTLLDMDQDLEQEQEEMERMLEEGEEEELADATINLEDEPIREGATKKLPQKIFQAPCNHDDDYPQPDLTCVPATIKKLYSLITSNNSDYAFVYGMCAQLAQECVPMDCYVYLKMVLLASVVSIEPGEVRAPISLCVISTDGLICHRLMNNVGQLATRFLGPHDHGLQPTFSALPVRYNWVVASPLALAQQGVYYVGDWTRLSKEHSDQLEKCIENGSVPVPQLQTEQILDTAVWTHWQPEDSSNQTVAFAKLCPIFGLPIYMGDEVSESLWNFHLQKNSSKDGQDDKDGLNIPEEDLRMLLHLLHQRKLSFTDRAQHMLQKYYVISRKERPTLYSGKTYVVLKQFAESFAKLALRLEVLESDVCVAIFHCEHFARKIFGSNDTPIPPPEVTSFSVISHIDPYMNAFGRWLVLYLERYEDADLGMQSAKRRRSNSWGLP